MSRGSIIRLGLVLIAVVVLQFSIVSQLTVVGVHPEIVWLLPLMVGMLAGSEAGAVVGFISGLMIDSLLPTPFGLSALVGASVGFASGLLSEQGVLAGGGEIWWVTPTVGGIGSMLAVLLYASLGWLFGYAGFFLVNLWVLLPLTLVIGAGLAIPVSLLVSWSIGDRRPRRRRRRNVQQVAW